MTPNRLEDVRDFLGLRRIAVAGLSRDEKHFSRALFREMAKRGYDLVPVNPQAAEIEGRRCCSAVSEIEPPVEGVLLMTSPAGSVAVMQDCAAAGVKMVWLYRALGSGAVHEAAVAIGHEHGMRMVVGECPFMFLEDCGWFHELHGWWRKTTGHYPVETPRADA